MYLFNQLKHELISNATLNIKMPQMRSLKQKQ